ncbi:7-carboxy-7-deazaguanine synthase QueE [Staphylococcus pseudintermedius]|uniref:7-carboxy-7-deazaguanine synthase QueE n=1 Tax=Staphylococcus pseudintermedius TaxID=283734 RepID=UPI0019ED7536|nr:7-carboxy-7-deazaguanine synthase QueE [Staphylococcus pseudintermedius]EHP0466835.1 7-carboxy-7-deazaguanine synthase QueE [Staphylococcus pseudintermedius]EIE3640222.1 7-carboxy-7-deazaguanine synthase QueE [Staphylococcus pseudintermedius]ELH1952243.1 7-carboxy-7-deazaguanine synthase QueE [Staphylococcus pseudintermedius]ELK4081759.1 7-carboxy-7-deazaguanine synthase QueE [Staphylococcus pseudintermedius]
MAKIPFLEVFGPTIQGEGMVIGKKTMFLRTYGCDYSCSWCDTKYTWDGSEKDNVRRNTAQEVFDLLVEEAGDKSFSHVTVSGGNPALIGKAMDEFIDICHKNGVKVGLETQGSIWRDWFLKIDDLTISPKPPSSLMKTDFNVLDDIVSKLLTHKVNFSLKIVYFNEKDKEYAKEVFNRFSDNNIPYYLSVGNESPYTDKDITKQLLNKLDELWNVVINEPEFNDVQALPQLHSIVWGNKRGV